ncbi:MAG: hypothetical protein QM817_10220 [Archangium sp.]
MSAVHFALLEISAQDAASEETWLANLAAKCRSHACWGIPCGGCQSGGVCDAMCICSRRTDEEDDESEGDDE